MTDSKNSPTKTTTRWQRFKLGKLFIRLDGGPAGVYYCETAEQYHDAVCRIILSGGSGLQEVRYFDFEGEEV